MVDEVDNVISTLFKRWESYGDPICIFNLFSTSIDSRLESDFKRCFKFQRLNNVTLPLGYRNYGKIEIDS